MSEKGSSGHRQRLRERFLANEAGSRTATALLELLLTYAIPRHDVKPLAEKLLQQFGSLSALFAASPEELAKCTGVKESSVVLLKAIDAMRGPQAEAEEAILSNKETAATPSKPKPPKQQQLPVPGPATQREGTAKPGKVPKEDSQRSAARPSKPRKPEPTISPKDERRKFQVSNGYLLEFDQLARVLHSLLDMKEISRISRQSLMEQTGLADRQLESLISVGSAMGLISRGKQTLSLVGEVIAQNDIFIESRATLEWCHYVGSASFRNLIWYEIFNTVLRDESPGNQDDWNTSLRDRLEGRYTPRTIGKHLYEEVRFVVDAYIERNFKKLELLHKSPDEKLYRRRYTRFEPLVLCAMLYDYGAALGTQLLQVGELATAPGTPATVFGVDAATLRQLVEGLHNRGWIRYETTHNLDQIRLKPSMTALDYLRAHYEHREPRPEDPQDSGELF